MDARIADADLAAGRRLMARLDAFAAFSDEPRRLTRLFLSDAHRRAAQAFIGWCGEAGLEATIDAAGNVAARYEGRRAGAPALMLGSHIDTVRDAGRYDGNYGALAALAVVEELASARRAPRSRDRNRRLRRRGGRSLPHHAHRLARARRELSGGRARPARLGRRLDARRAHGLRRRPRPRGVDPAKGRRRLRRSAYRAGTDPRGRGAAARHRDRDQRRDAGSTSGWMASPDTPARRRCACAATR